MLAILTSLTASSNWDQLGGGRKAEAEGVIGEHSGRDMVGSEEALWQRSA